MIFLSKKRDSTWHHIQQIRWTVTAKDTSLRWIIVSHSNFYKTLAAGLTGSTISRNCLCFPSIGHRRRLFINGDSCLTSTKSRMVNLISSISAWSFITLLTYRANTTGADDVPNWSRQYLYKRSANTFWAFSILNDCALTVEYWLASFNDTRFEKIRMRKLSFIMMSLDGKRLRRSLRSCWISEWNCSLNVLIQSAPEYTGSVVSGSW